MSGAVTEAMARDSSVALEAAIERLYVTAMEYRAEREALREALKGLTDAIEEAWPSLMHLPALVAARAALARVEA